MSTPAAPAKGQAAFYVGHNSSRAERFSEGATVSIRDRREPTFPGVSETRRTPEPADSPESDGRQPEQSGDNLIRIAVVVIAVASFLFVGERFYRWYVAHRALDQLSEVSEQAFDRAQAQLAELSASQRERLNEVRRRNAERTEVIRRERAASTTGQWLSKNCQDWTRARDDLRAETAKAEMERACAAYERYLETAIAPSGARGA